MSSADASIRRDTDGNPVWTFRVTDALLQANRRIAFPKEVAAELGCRPGALTRVAVEHPAGSRKLKVCLEQRDPPRTLVLNMVEPLKGMGASPAQLVDLVVTGRQRVALRRSGPSKRPEPTAEHQDFGPSTDNSPSSASKGRPAPWGTSPTPLLPRWYFDNQGEMPLPAEFTSIYPSMRQIADVENFWNRYSGPLDSDNSRCLRDMAQRLVPPKRLRVLRPGFEPVELDRLPLMNRTRNCVRRSLNSGALVDGTVGELMGLPAFGISSLLDLMCVLEAAENHRLDERDRPVADPNRDADRTSATAPASGDGLSALVVGLDEQSVAFQLIAAAAKQFRDATTLGDLLRLDLSDLIEAAGVGAVLDEVPLATEAPALATQAVELVSGALGQMTDTQRFVVLERVFAKSPKTLEELARKAGLSRERMRQLDRQARAALQEAAGPALDLLSLIASERLGAVTTDSRIDDVMIELLPPLDDMALAESLSVARGMLRAKIGYECRDGLCLSGTAVTAAEELKERGADIADDAGLIDADLIREQVGPELRNSLDALVKWIRWPRPSGLVALRDTQRSRTKAALIKIGEPATKEQLAKASGLAEAQVGGSLSNLPSVARADKSRWGLREWIDDVYEGIPAEIVQRINEDGGSTRLNRVLEELPRLFGVSESSVWAYLNTPAFRVEHGWVSEVHQHEFQLGPLDNVIDGYNEAGEPCWTFEIAQRHHEGYSLHGVPPEIAAALGCSFGSRSTASVRHPQGCQDISIIWRKTSMHGPEIGRLSDAIKALNARDATSVGLIIHNHQEVSFASASLLQHSRATARAEVSSNILAIQYCMGSGVRVGTALSGHLLEPTTSAEHSLPVPENAYG